jgi:hypothetical protein
MHIFKKDGFAAGSLLTWKKSVKLLITDYSLSGSAKSVLAEEEFRVLPS